jgi:hypothetical protein
MEDILIPLSFFALMFGIVFLRSREKMAMIEKGMYPGAGDKPRPFANLKWALLLLGSGLGLLTAWLLVRFVVAPNPSPAGFDHTGAFNPVFLYFSLIAIGGGTGLYLSYRIEKKESLQSNKG